MQVGNTKVRFGVFEADLRARELYKRGVRIPLQDKPFQVLAALLERPGQVVTRAELQKTLWPDVVVDVEVGLNNAVKKLRDALGDSPENPRFIETLKGRGYRFIAEVQADRAHGASRTAPATRARVQPSSRRGGRSSRVVQVLSIAVPVLLVSLAGINYWRNRTSAALPSGEVNLWILPFEVYGQEEGADYLGRVFAEAMTVELQGVPGIKILPVGQGVPHDGGTPATEEAGREMGVRQIVSGSLERDGDSLEVSLSLIDVRQNHVRWSTQRRAGRTDITALAVSLARQIAGKVGKQPLKLYDFVLNMQPSMAESDLWADALEALRREDQLAGLATTLRLVEAYPNDPNALALRACALFYTQRLPGMRDSLEAVTKRLKRIDPNEPTPDCIELELLRFARRFDEFDALCDKLLARNDLTPAARAWPLRAKGDVTMQKGDFEGAVQYVEEAMRLDPANYFNPLVLCTIHLEANKPEKALAYAKNAVALNPCFQSYIFLGETLRHLGRHDEALDAGVKACDIGPSSYCTTIAARLLRANRRRDALHVIRAIEKLPLAPADAYNLACFFALDGQRDKAIHYLRYAKEHGYSSDSVLEDEDLQSLHGDPEFESLAMEMRSPSESP